MVKGRKVSICLGIGLLVAVSVFVSLMSGCWLSAREQVDHIIASGDGDLAQLPSSATNILFDEWSGLFTGEAFAKIEMSATDLQTFISNSPALHSQNLEAEFDAGHQHLPRPESRSDRLPQHEYYSEHGEEPDWYNPTILGKGRSYHLWPNLWLYIDEEKNIVWLHLVKG